MKIVEAALSGKPPGLVIPVEFFCRVSGKYRIWSGIPETEHKGETSIVYWQTLRFDGLGFRIVEYYAEPGYWQQIMDVRYRDLGGMSWVRA